MEQTQTVEQKVYNYTLENLADVTLTLEQFVRVNKDVMYLRPREDFIQIYCMSDDETRAVIGDIHPDAGMTGNPTNVGDDPFMIVKTIHLVKVLQDIWREANGADIAIDVNQPRIQVNGIDVKTTLHEFRPKAYERCMAGTLNKTNTMNFFVLNNGHLEEAIRRCAEINHTCDLTFWDDQFLVCATGKDNRDIEFPIPGIVEHETAMIGKSVRINARLLLDMVENMSFARLNLHLAPTRPLRMIAAAERTSYSLFVVQSNTL